MDNAVPGIQRKTQEQMTPPLVPFSETVLSEVAPLSRIIRNFRASIKRRFRRAGVTTQNCPAHT